MLGVTWINSQIIYDGIIQGLAIAVIAVGVVLIYRATRIINFAVGNMGVIGAATLSLLVIQYHVPFWAALVVAIVIGIAFVALVEISVIRRLKKAPRVVVLVSTIGIAGLAEAISIEIPQPSDASAHYPAAFNSTWLIAGVHIRGADLGILILVPVAVIALSWFLDRTMVGKTVKAAAANPSLDWRPSAPRSSRPWSGRWRRPSPRSRSFSLPGSRRPQQDWPISGPRRSPTHWPQQ